MAMRLKMNGFTLLMDDFGSGYSSLNVLLETPFDVIKLDKKFMDNMMASDKGKLDFRAYSFHVTGVRAWAFGGGRRPKNR